MKDGTAPESKRQRVGAPATHGELIAQLRAAAKSKPKKKLGPAMCAALLDCLGCSEDDLTNAVRDTLQEGVDAMTKSIHEKTARHMAVQQADVCVDMRGVLIPQGCCILVAQSLMGPECARLSAVSKDWRAVIAAPQVWSELSPPKKMTSKDFAALLKRPQFSLLRAVTLPSIMSSKNLVANMLAACPFIDAISLNGMKGDGFKPQDYADVLATRRPLRVFVNTWGLASAPFLRNFSGTLQGLSCHWFSSQIARTPTHIVVELFKAIGSLSCLKFLRIGQHGSGRELAPGMMVVNDALFEPVAKNCKQLRQLVLQGVDCLGGPTWRALRENAPLFESILFNCTGFDMGQTNVQPGAHLCIRELIELPALKSIAIFTNQPPGGTKTSPLDLVRPDDIRRLLAWRLAGGGGGDGSRKLVLPQKTMDAMSAQAADTDFSAVCNDLDVWKSLRLSHILRVVDGSKSDLSEGLIGMK